MGQRQMLNSSFLSLQEAKTQENFTRNNFFPSSDFYYICINDDALFEKYMKSDPVISSLFECLIVIFAHKGNESQDE